MAINIALMLFCYLFYYCTLETNDDYYMKMIASGAFGKPDIHLTYINSIIGFILKALYSITRQVSWYEILQYSFICIALATLTFVFINKSKNNRLLLISFFVFMYMCAYDLYVHFQYTKTAAILTIAGYILLAYVLDNELNNKYIVLSVFLLLFGSMIRVRQFLACSFICISLFLPIIINYLSDYKDKKNFDKFKKLVISGVCCSLLFFVTLAIEKTNYSNEDWKHYLEYNSASTTLLDKGFPSYDENKNLYGELEIDNENIEMYQIWNYDDSINFDYNKIQILANNANKIHLSLNSIISYVVTAIAFFFQYKKILFWTFSLCVVFCLCLFTNNRKVRTYLPIVYTIVSLLCVGFYCWLIRIDNVYVYRVHVSFMFVSTFILMYLCDVRTNKINSLPVLLSIIVFCTFFTFHWFSTWRIVNLEKTSDFRKNCLEEIYNDNNHLYIRAEKNEIFFLDKQFEINTEYSANNLTSYGGWMTNSPLKKQIREKYNVDNLYLDSVDNEKVYILSEKDMEINLITSYIERNFGISVKSEIVKQINNSDFYAYRIISTNN